MTKAMNITDTPLLDRIERLYTCILSDMSEAISDMRLFLGQDIQSINGDHGTKMAGFAFPARVRRTNEYVEIDKLLEMVDAVPPNSVVVVEGDEGLECALWGGLMSAAAQRRAARGAVTNGLVRDVEQIARLGFPVFGTGRTALDIRGRAQMVEYGRPVQIRGVPIRPGDVVFGDANGVLVVPVERIETLLARAEQGAQDESSTQADLLHGETARAVFGRYGRF
ncbi:MAG: hypothetical protein GEU99_20310 [Luteitalea sp.]|nr:hypothetical protein [Luteitalea sp.]